MATHIYTIIPVTLWREVFCNLSTATGNSSVAEKYGRFSTGFSTQVLYNHDVTVPHNFETHPNQCLLDKSLSDGQIPILDD